MLLRLSWRQDGLAHGERERQELVLESCSTSSRPSPSGAGDNAAAVGAASAAAWRRSRAAVRQVSIAAARTNSLLSSGLEQLSAVNGGYHAAFLAGGIFALVAAGSAFLLREPAPERLAEVAH